MAAPAPGAELRPKPRHPRRRAHVRYVSCEAKHLGGRRDGQRDSIPPSPQTDAVSLPLSACAIGRSDVRRIPALGTPFAGPGFLLRSERHYPARRLARGRPAACGVAGSGVGVGGGGAPTGGSNGWRTGSASAAVRVDGQAGTLLLQPALFRRLLETIDLEVGQRPIRVALRRPGSRASRTPFRPVPRWRPVPGRRRPRRTAPPSPHG